ncbi:MFS transporter [Undibacterium sp. TJN25]|uniref:MFS transporter n=1 Tax=Undibacterium sp. TJN25 TaxID=3413056 RepID=UPI003BF1830F
MPEGALADRYGRKRTILIGLAAITLASLICRITTNVLVLNCAREVQGIGAAMRISATFDTLSHSFRGPERARALAS